MKLRESIPSNSIKIIDLYNKIDSLIIDTSPDSQRKLAWKKQHKYSFIETILMNYPFPEIYIASSEMDVNTLKSREIVVDGKQRLTAIVEYIKGINDFKDQNEVKAFDELTVEEKRDFLNYLVTVKDLKHIDMELIKEIFQRINSKEYALNIIERTNAQYGDGEFAVFCKQVVDPDYNPGDHETDIVLNKEIKIELNNFFKSKNIFNENDRSRMFDVQYVMLIISTFLEGEYYSRSSKVNVYLERYNSEFKIYKTPLSLLLKSIRIINVLDLSKMSYWFNKANLFTLIIELAKHNTDELDIKRLELQLLELENKVDYYFCETSLETPSGNEFISEDEKKYFEAARQGSHEKAARIHRGKVINELICSCLRTVSRSNAVSPELNRIQILSEKGILFTTIEPTKTGLAKSIMDATSSMRTFLKTNQIHDFDTQNRGTENKVKIKGKYILENQERNLEVSLYRANNRGDARIWFSGLNTIAQPNDVMAFVLKNGNIYILNISQLRIEDLLEKANPLNSLLND